MATPASSTPLSIRRATASDAAAILDCLRRAFEPYRERYSPEGFLDPVLTPSTIDDRLASMAVLVAITPDGATVGTVAWQSPGRRRATCAAWRSCPHTPAPASPSSS